MIVVREICPRNAADPIDTLNLNGVKVLVTEDIMLTYLICTTDGSVKVLLTTEGDLKRRGFKRLYAESADCESYQGHEACEAHS